MNQITGETLINWGYTGRPGFKIAIEAAEKARMSGIDEADIKKMLDEMMPAAPPTTPMRKICELGYEMNITSENDLEIENIGKVVQHMDQLMRVPTIVKGAIMPDACPAGQQPGTIPVGGIVACKEAIHPGFHSADICCSMAISVVSDCDPKLVLDAAMKLSHFGGGGRSREDSIRMPAELVMAFDEHPLLKDGTYEARLHFATQGDGNHFFYVGRLKSTGELAIVTHHGSRKPGANLYKKGMKIAENYRKKLSPETPSHNAWIPSETDDGRSYWSALQVIREWTKANHYAIHDLIVNHLGLKVNGRFWNEHNFVFQKSDGLFYHAKGATPAWDGWANDATGFTLIPLNMAEPILITKGLNADNGLGFAPHGAGRNLSRSGFMKSIAGKTAEQVMAEETQFIDARFFCGIPDISELPSAYKNAKNVRE